MQTQNRGPDWGPGFIYSFDCHCGLRAAVAFAPVLLMKFPHGPPVASSTIELGSACALNPNSRHPRGNAGSHVT